jgi:hypothetical protein
MSCDATSGSRSRRQHGLSPHPSTRSCARRRADVPSRRSGPGVQALGFAPVPGRGCGFAGRRNFTGKQLKLLKKWWRRRESKTRPLRAKCAECPRFEQQNP